MKKIKQSTLSLHEDVYKKFGEKEHWNRISTVKKSNRSF